jgi:hypothetical protein
LWGRPKPGAFKQFDDGLLNVGKGRVQHWPANYEHQVIACRDVRIHPPHCLSNTALGSISVVRFAKLLAHNKTTASTPYPIPHSIQNEQRVRPGLTVATHPLKLLWPLQPLAPPHAASLAMSAWYTTALIAHR